MSKGRRSREEEWHERWEGSRVSQGDEMEGSRRRRSMIKGCAHQTFSPVCERRVEARSTRLTAPSFLLHPPFVAVFTLAFTPAVAPCECTPLFTPLFTPVRCHFPQPNERSMSKRRLWTRRWGKLRRLKGGEAVREASMAIVI